MASQLKALTPRTDATAKLLLLLARPELSANHRGAVRRYAQEIDNWSEFTHLAAEKFIATFALRHIRACAEDIAPAGSIAELRAFAMGATRSTLRVASALSEFHRACILPTEAPHAYLKGLALARLYMRDIGQRHCRDIDVLVPESHFGAVVQRAAACGYQVFIDEMPGQRIERPQDIRFVIDRVDVVSLVGADTVAVDVHKRLDKRVIRFDVNKALASCQELTLAGVAVKALSPALHFNYLCYHHARHFWSHLHWLADLNALAESLATDRAEIFEIADKIGIRPTAEAGFEFSSLSARPEDWATALSAESGGGQFLRACLVNLSGGLELEEGLRRERPYGEVMGTWQISKRHRDRAFRNWLARRLRPGARQYFKARLPRAFHSVYVLQNAALLLWSGLLEARASFRRLAHSLSLLQGR